MDSSELPTSWDSSEPGIYKAEQKELMGEARPPRSYLREVGDQQYRRHVREGSKPRPSDNHELAGSTREVSTWEGPLGLFLLPFYLGGTWSGSPRVVRGEARWLDVNPGLLVYGSKISV